MYSAHKEGPPIGVDFGSQSCRCYVWKNGRTTQIGPSSFANLVALKDHLMHGRDAGKELDNRHSNVVRHITASMKTRRPIQMEHPSSGQREFEIDELASYLLDGVRRGASKMLGADILRACVSLPIALNAVERARFIAASIAAGYTSFEIVPSTAMGALYWAHCTRVLGTPDVKRELLVLDVGHRFASVSIVRLSHSPTSSKDVKIELLASRGLRDGGYSTDLALCSYLDSAIGAQGINDIQLINAAEKAKKELSALKEASFQCRDHKRLITKKELDAASEDFIQALKALIRCVLVEHPNVDLGVLIGGASRMNAIQNYVKSVFKLTVDVVDSDYGAVMGAAIFANSIDVKLEIVERSYPHDYWVCSTDGVIRKLFTNGNQEILPDKTALGGWWVFQRLKGSSPGEEPTKEELAMCALQPRGDPTYSRARTDAIPDDENEPCADSSRPPPMTLPPHRAPIIKQIFLRREAHEPIGLQLRKIESRIVIIEVKPGSASAKQGFNRYAGWILTHAQDIPIVEIKQLQAACEGKTDVCLTVASPADTHVKRDIEFIGTCDGGPLTLQTSGLVKGLIVPVPPVMDDIKIDETKCMIETEHERMLQMKQFSEVRNDLDEVIIRGDDMHPSQLNKYCASGEELLMMAGVMLECTTKLSRKKKLAKLQLNKMFCLSKVLLKMLDLYEAGKTSGGDKVKELEAEFQKAAQALDEYDSADEVDERGHMKLKKMMSLGGGKKSLRRKATVRQSSASPTYNKTYTGTQRKSLRTAESVYHKKSYSPDRDVGVQSLHRSMSSNGLSGRQRDPQSPNNKNAANMRKAVIEELRAASRALDTYTNLSPIPRSNTAVFASPSRLSPKMGAGSPLLKPGSPNLKPGSPRHGPLQITPRMSPKRQPAGSPRRGGRKKKKKPHTFEQIDSDSASTLDIMVEDYTTDDASDDGGVRLSGIPVTTSVFKTRNDSLCSPPRSPSKKDLRLSHGVPQSVKDALERASKKTLEKHGSELGSPTGMTRKRSSTMGALPTRRESFGHASPVRLLGDPAELPKRPKSRLSTQKQRPPLHPSASNSSGSPKPEPKEDAEADKRVSKPLSRSIKGVGRLPSVIDSAASDSSAGRRDSVSSMNRPRPPSTPSPVTPSPTEREPKEKIVEPTKPTKEQKALEAKEAKAKEEQKRIASELIKIEVKYEKEDRDKVVVSERQGRSSIADEKKVALKDLLEYEAKKAERQRAREREELVSDEVMKRSDMNVLERQVRHEILETAEEGKEAIVAAEMLASTKKLSHCTIVTMDDLGSPASSTVNTGTFSSPHGTHTPNSEKGQRPRKPSAHIPRVAGISPSPVTKKAPTSTPKHYDLGESMNVPRVAALAPNPKPVVASSQPKQHHHDINIASSHVPRVAQIAKQAAKGDTFSTPPKAAPKVGGPTAPPPKNRATSPLRSPVRSPSPRSRSPISSGSPLRADLHTSQHSSSVKNPPPSYKNWKEDKRPPPLQTDNSSQSSSQQSRVQRSLSLQQGTLKTAPRPVRSGNKEFAHTMRNTKVLSGEHEPPLKGIVKDASTPKLTPKAAKVTIQKPLLETVKPLSSTTGSDMMLKSNGTTPAATPGRAELLKPSFETSLLSSPNTRPSSHPSSHYTTPGEKPLTPSTSTVPAAVKNRENRGAKRTLSPRGGMRMAESQIVMSSSDFSASLEDLNRTLPCMEFINVRSEGVTEEYPPPVGPKRKQGGMSGTYGRPRDPKGDDQVKSTPAFRRSKEEKKEEKKKLGAFSKSMPLIRRASEDDARRRTATATTVSSSTKKKDPLSKSKRGLWAAPSGPTFSGKASSRSATAYYEHESTSQQARRRPIRGVSPVPNESSRRSLNSNSESPALKRSHSRSRSSTQNTQEEDRDVLIDKLRHQLKSAGLQTSAAVPR
eukprot:TRINITY_DN437_c1_g1_i1.p1 TRINITY_DN437_c1_g1~~TRINITY_DN437_c1_g1_i1.p1  ORF type:complete len:1893 (+),score=441.59 TRINITY_DN437_c1_g1_i1:104-5782(+)